MTICEDIEEQKDKRFRLDSQEKIFPARVEKIEMGNLAFLSSDFLKFLQPGTISSTGEFKKSSKENSIEFGISDNRDSFFPHNSFSIE